MSATTVPTMPRDYVTARRQYGLPAVAALAYFRDRATLRAWLGDWVVDVDADDWEGPALSVGLTDESGEVVDCLGGIDLPFSVSDHGNILFDEYHPYFVGIVADMIRGHAGR